MREGDIENKLIEKLSDLKYAYRPDIRDRLALEKNFREKFEALNQVHLSDTEFARILEEIITPDVYAAAKRLRERNSFEAGTTYNNPPVRFQINSRNLTY